MTNLSTLKMPTAIIRLLALTGVVAMASPLSARQSTQISTSKSFQLVFNVTIPGTDFVDAPVNGVSVTQEHVGAGIDALVPVVTGSTAIDLLYTSNDTIQNGINSTSWQGLRMGTTAVTGNDYLYGLDLFIGSPTTGFGIPVSLGTGQSCIAAYAPLTGTFAVCDIGISAPEVPQYPLYFVEGDSTDWYAAENVPDNCVAVKLLPQCSSETDYDDVDGVEEVLCYEDVDSIDWSQQELCV